MIAFQMVESSKIKIKDRNSQGHIPHCRLEKLDKSFKTKTPNRDYFGSQQMISFFLSKIFLVSKGYINHSKGK